MSKPLSKEFLLNRGYCCGNGCLNCPYIPKHQKHNDITKDKINEISICGESIKIYLKNGTTKVHVFKNYNELKSLLEYDKSDSSS